MNTNDCEWMWKNVNNCMHMHINSSEWDWIQCVIIAVNTILESWCSMHEIQMNTVKSKWIKVDTSECMWIHMNA